MKDNNSYKDQRCKFCGKLLLNEKTPICRRCFLRWRNKALKGGGVGTFLAIIIKRFSGNVNGAPDGIDNVANNNPQNIDV